MPGMEGQNIEGLLLDRKRKNILKEVYPEIKEELDRNYTKGNIGSERSAVGRIFEILAIEERIIGSETRKQKAIRKIIEDVYQNSELLLGSLKPQNPDFVSVIFDKHGNLIINEIVEVKVSTGARKESKSAGQPQGTLNSIEKIVDIANLLISGADVSTIPSETPLSPKRNQERIKYLEGLRNKIKNLQVTEKILFSENLKYVYVLPSDYSDRHIPDILLTSEKLGKIKGETVFSKFSRKNVEDVIDRYAETP